MGLYPSIPHRPGLKALKNVLEKREQKYTLTENDKMTEYDKICAQK